MHALTVVAARGGFVRGLLGVELQRVADVKTVRAVDQRLMAVGAEFEIQPISRRRWLRHDGRLDIDSRRARRDLRRRGTGARCEHFIGERSEPGGLGKR